MLEHTTPPGALPPQQQAIRAKCVHPTGTFIPFLSEDIEQSIAARFEQQVGKYPARLAVKTRTEGLSYAALNAAANRIAHALLAQRGEESEPIALLLEPDTLLLAALLGVLKAGKFYIVLAPGSPWQRMAAILGDAQAALLLTTTRHLALTQQLAQSGVPWLNLDTLETRASPENPGLPIPSERLAYIIYTSGSTGQPKGVIKTHHHVLTHIRNYTNILRISPEDRLSLLHARTFGAAKYDIFGALLNGAALMPWDVPTAGMAPITSWLGQEGISIVHWLPSAFRQLVSTLTGGETFPALRVLVLASEPVSRRDLELYQRYCPATCLFVNRLGSTETGNVRFFFADQTTQLTGPWVPVGYAVEDMEVMLLDEAGQAVGVGDEGEIVVRSRYLAPGYWRRPDLTQAAFLSDPHGGNEGLYRRGDVGRMLPDGCLVHLGRKDFQVKIRGHRIEVDEIELALLDSAAIKEAVVVAREDGTGGKRLVAYVVPAQGSRPTIRELRSGLRAKLPEYMVPSAFIFLDALPLTPNGKVDRLALPAPNQARPELAETFLAPSTPVEEVVAGIWAEILRLEQIGVHDNLLDLGGDSLLATQVMARIRRAFQVELPPHRFFEAPTVAELAQAIIANEPRPGQTEKIARMLERIEGMSAKDVTSMLQQKRKEGGHR